MNYCFKRAVAPLFFTLCLLMSASRPLYAQETQSGAGLEAYSAFINKLVVSPSPEAASLGKYGNNDVNYHTGAMSLSIPINTIGGRDIKLPIGLSYDGSGNRVEQLPSMVGLAWALSAGGVITRSVRGNPDKDGNYFSRSTDQVGSSDPFEENDHLLDVVKGAIETQPDDYFFNFAGMSGKFSISSGKVVRMRKQQDLLIEPTITGDVDEFVITDSRGNKYYFTAVETTHLELDDAYGVIPATRRVYDYNSSWFLKKVESANNTETIELDYETVAAAYSLPVNSYNYESVTYKYCGSQLQESFSNNGININQVKNRRFIKKITYKLGADVLQTATFEIAASSHPFAEKQLQSIKFYNAEAGDTPANMPVNQFSFTYDGSTNRLTLKSIQEKSLINVAEVKNPHTFVYHTTQLPTPTSNSIDHWGFYNGVGNASLIPSYSSGCNQPTYPGGNADRETNPNEVKAGVMTRINYPTGGYSVFNYEANTVKSADPCAPSVETLRYVGGLRLESSKNYEANGTLLTTKKYNYLKEDGTTSGYLTNDVNYTSSSSYTTYSTQCWNESCTEESNCATYNALTIGTSNNAALGTSDGAHINYSRIEEVTPTAGKTVYHYTGEDLVKKEVVNEAGVLLSESLYQYTSDNRNASLFGYMAVAKQEQDNRTQLLRWGSQMVWRMPMGDTRLYLNQCPVPYVCPSKTYLTKFQRSGYLIMSDWKQTSRVTEKLYTNGNMATPIVTIQDFVYGNKNISQPTYTLVTNSDGTVHKTQNYFPHDLQNNAAHPSVPAMLNSNRIGIALKTELYVGTKLTQAQEMVYAPFGSQLLPKSIRARLKDNTWETLFTVDSYNEVGLPTKTTAKGFSVSTFYTWAKQTLKSKQVGATLSASTNFISRYDYGYADMVATATDENGFKSTFFYDDFLRLKEVKSYFADGTLRSTTANTYHYRPVNGTLSNAMADNNYVRQTTTFVDIPTPLSTLQYFDGLGRPTEVVKVAYTPKTPQHPNEAWHQKNYITYDALGRQDKSYHPFESNTLDVEAAPSGTPFGYPQYEASPLSRATRQYAEDGKYVEMAYGTNESIEVRYFAVTTSTDNSTVTPSGFYAPNTLYKTTMTNENGTMSPNGNLNKTDIFKDKLGRVILTRKYVDNTEMGKVDTYNIYDDYGNLIMVIPPSSIETNNIKEDLVFCYKYNNKNQLCEKKIPGADAQKFYYNDRNLLTFVQDGNMRAANANKYLATEYDQYGRILRTSWVETNSPDTYALSGDFTNIRTDWINDYYEDRVLHPVTNVMYVTSTAVRTRPIATQGTLKTGDKLLMWRSIQYNTKGEKEWTCPEYLRANNCDDYVWNADGTLKSGNKYNNWKDDSQRSFNQVFYGQKYEYDHARRNTSVQQRLWGPNGSGGAFYAPWVELSAMNYNYKDQVIEKNIGRRTDIWGAKALQSIDYQYNQRGWLTEINQQPLSYHNMIVVSGGGGMSYTYPDPNPTFSIQYGEGSVDLFSESIRYGNPDNNISNIGTPQYNGNISQAVWQVAGREQQAYTYKYDALDRLLEGEYTDIHDMGGYMSDQQEPYSTDNKFGEKLTYDMRGNILSLQRNGMIAAGLSGGSVVTGTFGQIDNLTYIYGDSNRIKRITDGANATKGFKYAATGGDRDYDYDKNGNLVADRNKGITRITYNYLNLPQTIEFTNNRKIEFVYDGTGMKLRKTTWENGVIKETRDYMENFEYKDDKIERIQHSEGVITQRALRSGESTEFVGLGGLVWQYEYTLKDHLGNTRVTFADIDGSGTIDPNTEINQINHYAPFGLNLEGNWNGAAGSNKYQLTGKEWNDDFGLGLNDFGARMYDPAIGRWNGVDPLAEAYRRWSPYNYTKDNPVNLIDPDGMRTIDPRNNTGRPSLEEEHNQAKQAQADKRQELEDNMSDAYKATRLSISIPNEAQRPTILKMINDRASGLFSIDENGKLHLDKMNKDGKDDEGHSNYYRDRLIKAIGGKKEIEIRIQRMVKVDKDKDGIYSVGKGDRSVDESSGGGENWSGTNELVIISGNSNYDKNVLGEDGKPLAATSGDILMHELLAHAIPHSVGGDTGHGIKNENKARSEMGKRLRQVVPHAE
jgi:RHS repeat-associated protein